VGSRVVAYFLSIVINFMNMNFSPGTVHVQSEVTEAEVAPQVTSESQATEASDKDCTRITGSTDDTIASVCSQKKI
jgi:hypothetical protein